MNFCSLCSTVFMAVIPMPVLLFTFWWCLSYLKEGLTFDQNQVFGRILAVFGLVATALFLIAWEYICIIMVLQARFIA